MTGHTVRISPSAKRVRVVFGGEVIADAPDGMYVWEHPFFPQYYLPLSAVADGVLTPIADREGRGLRCDVLGGGRVASGAAVSFPDHPIPELHDHVRFEFGAMDASFEEDEEIIVHPRDPGTRVQTLPSSPPRHGQRGRSGDSRRRPPDVPPRDGPAAAHLPPQARRAPRPADADDHLVAVPVQGHGALLVGHDPGRCACRPGVELPDPLRESMGIAGLIAFYDEHVDVTVDGVALPRPVTKFS